MAWNTSNRLHSVLIFAIKLRQLLTGEGYVLLKIFGDSLRRHGCFTMPAEVKRSHNPTSSCIQEREKDEKILGLTRKIIQLLTREVPIRYEDITVFFTMKEWEYVEEHKDLYEDVLVENTIHLKYISDHDHKILYNTSGKISDSKIVHQDRKGMNEKILHLAKEIIHLLIKEKYILIWNHGNHTTLSGTDRVSGLITEPSTPSLMQEKNNYGKILDLTNRIIEVLNGETWIRYEDIKVCFSMEEWDYIEQHKDFYKDIMMENEVVESYDTSCSLDLTKEMPLKSLQHSESSCILTHNSPYQVVKSTKSCHNQPNIVKHKRKSNHREQTPVICCKCEKPLKRTDIGHMETSDSSGSKKFCRKCILDERCKNTQKRRFSCLECSSCFSNKSSLDIHLRIHTLSKIFTCSECDKIFTNNTCLESHMRVHTGEKPYKCSECGKYFRSTGNLQAHYRVHTGEKPFPCSECDKTFRYKSHLVAHQRFHTGQTLPCSECGKNFIYQSHLVKHLRIHTGEKPYKCPECGKCFHRSSQLAHHEMIHTGESPFKCEECDKCFRFPSDMFRHQKTHTGEKPYYCSECGKSFTRSTSLNEHTMLHTGEKPYSCPKCGNRFVTYNYMLRHLKTHNSKKKKKGII